MFAETGLLFPYSQNCSQQLQSLGDFYQSHKPNVSMPNPVETSTILEYDMGEEGDLFKAPDPIIEESLVDIDLMSAAAISMISCGDEVIPSQALDVADSIQSDQLLSDAFYGCRNELLEKNAIESSERPAFEVLDDKTPAKNSEGNQMVGENLLSEGPFQKSISSGWLNKMEWNNGHAIRPSFLDFTGIDFGSGMRRAFSEGDIKALANGHISLIQSPHERHNCNSEERREKLSRYRNKKKKRNFGRKIKYACRKALADTQPRVRGRFAKTEEPDMCRKQ